MKNSQKEFDKFVHNEHKWGKYEIKWEDENSPYAELKEEQVDLYDEWIAFKYSWQSSRKQTAKEILELWKKVSTPAEMVKFSDTIRKRFGVE